MFIYANYVLANLCSSCFLIFSFVFTFNTPSFMFLSLMTKCSAWKIVFIVNEQLGNAVVVEN